MFTQLLMVGVWVAGAAGQYESTKPREGQFCGGLAAVQCSEGLICVDDPTDSCDPDAGGADCGGVCIDPNSQKKPKCDYDDPDMTYVSRDVSACPAIFFKCPVGSTAFFNGCGCGCQSTSAACNYEDPNRRYVSQEPDQCSTLRFVCEPGESAFFDSCGCGCELTPTQVP